MVSTAGVEHPEFADRTIKALEQSGAREMEMLPVDMKELKKLMKQAQQGQKPGEGKKPGQGQGKLRRLRIVFFDENDRVKYFSFRQDTGE